MYFLVSARPFGSHGIFGDFMGRLLPSSSPFRNLQCTEEFYAALFTRLKSVRSPLVFLLGLVSLRVSSFPDIQQVGLTGRDSKSTGT